jgi:hypothetical protein
LVEVRETVKEIVIPVYVQTEFRRTEACVREEPIFAGTPMTNCWATVCPASGSTMSLGN